MMRAATALIMLFSVLSAPIASAVCGECCNRSVEHQLPLYHDKAHAPLGPHVHHMNHVPMVMQDSDAHSVVRHCEHQIEGRRLSCHTPACFGARPVQPSAASVPAHQLRVRPHLIASTISCSGAISGRLRPPGVCRIEISSAPSASVPLRI